MPCACKSVFGQVVVLCALGGAIGVADAFVFRPVELHRAPPPPLETPKPSGDKPTQPIPPVPTPPAPAGATPIKLTPKDQLPPGHVTIEDAKAQFDAGATFIDTRKIEPYKLGHVRGAFRIELADFSSGNPPILAMIARDSIVIVYCSGGHCDESEAVARMMTGSGYKRVYVMHDGIPAWTHLGHPVVTGDQPE